MNSNKSLIWTAEDGSAQKLNKVPASEGFVYSEGAGNLVTKDPVKSTVLATGQIKLTGTAIGMWTEFTLPDIITQDEYFGRAMYICQTSMGYGSLIIMPNGICLYWIPSPSVSYDYAMSLIYGSILNNTTLRLATTNIGINYSKAITNFTVSTTLYLNSIYRIV